MRYARSTNINWPDKAQLSLRKLSQKLKLQMDDWSSTQQSDRSKFIIEAVPSVFHIS